MLQFSHILLIFALTVQSKNSFAEVTSQILTLPRKLVIIGDGACGKTSLLSVFTLGYFPTVSLTFVSPDFQIANKSQALR